MFGEFIISYLFGYYENLRNRLYDFRKMYLRVQADH